MPNRRGVLTRRALLAAAVGAPALSACSRGGDVSAPRLKVRKVWARTVQLYGHAHSAMILADRMSILGDTLVRADGTGDKARIVAVDVAGGDARWTLDGGTPVTAPTVGPVLVRVLGPRRFYDELRDRPVLRAGRGVLPVSYVGDGHRRTTSGVLGIDVATGEPRWGFAAVPRPSAVRSVVTAVSGAVVVVTLARRVGPQWADSGGPVTTVVLDAATGKRLWSRPALVGLAADADAVVAAEHDPGSGDWLPCVLDARTGRRRWRGRNSLRTPFDHVATAAGHTVFKPADPDMTSPLDPEVVRLSTGELLEFTGGRTSTPRPVATDPPLLLWDNGPDPYARGPNGFVTQALPDGDVRRGRERPGGYEFTPAAGTGGPYVWGDYTSTNGGLFEPDPTQPTGVVAVDRTGGPRSPSLRGTLADVTDRWLVLTVEDLPVYDEYRIGFEVHRITST